MDIVLKSLKWTAAALLGLALLTASGPGAPADTPDDPADFVQQFSSKAIEMLGDTKLSSQEREAAFRELLTEKLALDQVARFVLGKHWRSASEEERAEFRQVFEDFLVVTYARRLESYSGESVQVGAARERNDGSVGVACRIVRAEGEPIGIEWRLRQNSGKWRIVDLVVEGVSLALTQRNEFDAMLRDSGDLRGLMDQLRQKASQPASAS